MENKKKILIGLGVIIGIAVIILIVMITGKNSSKGVPVEPTPLTTVTPPEASLVKKSAPKASVSAIFPTTGSLLKRGTVYTITWKGTASCYDLGYVLNPKQDTSYNFIGKACTTSAGTFSYKWTVPPNIVPGTYGLELRTSGSMEHGTDLVSFLIK